MTPPIIFANKISKSFALPSSPLSLLCAIFGFTSMSRRKALKNISLTLNKGESIAIIGQNGAGKSTLLKILTGVLLPDSGELKIEGTVAALLELGAGFDMRLTGRQNIYANATLLGMQKKEIYAKESSIVEFSELGVRIDDPVRTYSSGMIMRLGFAIAIHSSPACFIVDEALSVGDASFQQKCLRAIDTYRKNGGSLLFVSHDFNMIQKFCDRAIVLADGEVAFEGDTAQAVKFYIRHISNMAYEEMGTSDRYGFSVATIEKAELLSSSGAPQKQIISGSDITLSVHISAKESVSSLSLGFLIKDRLGMDMYGTNTTERGVELNLQKDEVIVVRFSFKLTLGAGKYSITLGLHDSNDYTQNVQDWLYDALSFEVIANPNDRFVGPAGQILHSITIGKAI